MLAVAEHKGLRTEVIPRIATGFCSGLARTGGMCGAVSGGVMGISLYLGRSAPTEERDRCYEAVRGFLGRFSSQFGELNCQKLTGVDLGTVEGQAQFAQKGQIKLCSEYVGEAVRIALEMISGSNTNIAV